MMNKLINKIVNELIRRILTEKQGVSDAVIDDVKFCVDKIGNAFYSNEFNDISVVNINGFNIRRYQIDLDFHMLYARNITIYIYDLDKNSFNECVNDIPLDSYNENGHITISTYSINRDLSYRRLYEALSHELLHELQNIKTNGHNNSEIYNLALSRMVNASSVEEYKVAMLLYYFDKKEIAARLTQLYSELLFKRREDSFILKTHMKMCHEYYDIIKKHDINNILNGFGLTLNMFNKIILNGMKMFDSKSRKVIGRIKNERNVLKHKMINGIDLDPHG